MAISETSIHTCVQAIAGMVQATALVSIIQWMLNNIPCNACILACDWRLLTVLLVEGQEYDTPCLSHRS